MFKQPFIIDKIYFEYFLIRFSFEENYNFSIHYL
ncbi:hypothetical protein SAMN04488055_3416 [Chitinophaga niabensis]|uniref:Uncharacterized protein n=1 Tax=Chitinophaga niabensis TaxID=536979 RepID=A0A1N6IWP3_9BACT|nr:hypothetical protein SAMN04488055_3416 [Chitinophaga niabensis]